MSLSPARDCGPLLNLSDVQRQLHLTTPVAEGHATIEVAHIIGTASRSQDFDGCFRPLTRSLRKRIEDIRNARPATLEEPVDVVRVDRAYFVVDGHKRVALARMTGREFIDARVSRLRSPYELRPEVDVDAIERTAREGEFRRHTGLHEGVPDARFPLGDINGYGEMFHAVQTFAFEIAQRTGALPSRAETARAWYDAEYLPTVARGREVVGDLIDQCTDADVYLAMLRHSRAHWGTTCDAAECAAEMLLAERRREEAQLSVERLLWRRNRPEPAAVLPLAGRSDGA